jgi:hypothetical protein
MTFPLKIVGLLKSKVEPVDQIVITTNQSSLQTVGITLAFSTGTLTVDWDDGSANENFTTGVEKTKNYAGTGTYEIKISGDLTEITRFIADNSRITSITGLKTGLLTDFRINDNLYSGTLDMSNAPVSGLFHIHVNAGLSGIISASSGNGTLNDVRLYGTSITSLDLNTPDIPISGIFFGPNNASFTSISFASSGNGTLTYFTMSSTGLTSLDLNTPDIPISGIFSIRNGSLTSIDFANAGNGSVSQMYLDNNDLIFIDFKDISFAGITRLWIYSNFTLGDIDISGVSGNINSFRGYSCDLTNIDFSGLSTPINPEVSIQSNNMTSTEVDDQIINLDNTGWINGILNIAGTNAARTSASDTAYNNLIANGWTITVN